MIPKNITTLFEIGWKNIYVFFLITNHAIYHFVELNKMVFLGSGAGHEKLQKLSSVVSFFYMPKPLYNTYNTCYAVSVRRWNMKDKDLLKLLKKNGWNVVRINGSHHVLQKDGKTIVVPLHGKDVPIGLLNSILKEAGLK